MDIHIHIPRWVIWTTVVLFVLLLVFVGIIGAHGSGSAGTGSLPVPTQSETP